MKLLALVISSVFLINNSVASTNPTYQFNSQFDSAKNSVSYSGQVFRQLLNTELKITMDMIKRGEFQDAGEEAYESLWSYVDYYHDNDSIAMLSVNGEVEFESVPKNTDGQIMSWSEGLHFNDIAKGKQLLNKMAGNDNPLTYGKVLGWDLNSDSTPQDLLSYFIENLAENSEDSSLFVVKHPNGVKEQLQQAAVTKEGLDLTQLSQKLLHGAVSFSQMAGDYLSTDLGPQKGLNADNTKPYKGTKPYTALEHHWDEAFGYFGAARDYLNYTDLEIRKGYSIDSNQDGSIAMNSEKNFGLSVLAAKRDLGAETDFTGDIFTDFYKGRKLISEKPNGYLDEVKILASNILLNVEKVIAASVIHYINKTLSTMDTYGTKSYSFAKHAKYWSEMKGYALAFQFNPHSPLSKEKFIDFHSLVADQPVLMTATSNAIADYKAKLLEARDILEDTYGFKADNVKNW